MKVNSFFILLLTLSRLIPTASVVCRILADDFENELVSFNCRNRPDFNLLGGPGCQFTCLAKNSTCSELDGGEVCGKFRFRGGFYAFGKTVAEFCLIPDGGLLAGRFGRYCVTFRVCLLQGGLCGCRVVADGRRCRCRIETVDGEPTPVSNCPFYTNDPSQPERSAAGFFPSEHEFEAEMSLIVGDDDGLQYNVEEAYSSFLHLFGSRNSST